MYRHLNEHKVLFIQVQYRFLGFSPEKLVMTSRISINVETFGTRAHIMDGFEFAIEFDPNEPWGPEYDDERWVALESPRIGWSCFLYEGDEESGRPLLTATLLFLGDEVELVIAPNPDFSEQIEFQVEDESATSFVVRTTRDWSRLSFERR